MRQTARYAGVCESYYVLNKAHITLQHGWDEGAKVTIWLDRDLTIPATCRSEGRWLIISYQKRDIAAVETAFRRHGMYRDRLINYLICPKCNQPRTKLYS